MQRTENPESNQTAEVEPTIWHTVPWRVTSVSALPDSRLSVAFVDGVTGDVDMRSFLSDPKIDGPSSSRCEILESLLKPASFWERFSGRTAPTSRRMRCMMPFANIVFGFWSETVVGPQGRELQKM